MWHKTRLLRRRFRELKISLEKGHTLAKANKEPIQDPSFEDTQFKTTRISPRQTHAQKIKKDMRDSYFEKIKFSIRFAFFSFKENIISLVLYGFSYKMIGVELGLRKVVVGQRDHGF